MNVSQCNGNYIRNLPVAELVCWYCVKVVDHVENITNPQSIQTVGACSH